MKLKLNLSQRIHSIKSFLFLILILIAMTSRIATARDVTVSELGEGACLFNFNKEELRVASFNDKTSFVTTFRLLDLNSKDLIFSKFNLDSKLSYKTINYNLHCSSIGASVIVRSKVDEQIFCSWLYIKEGKFAARSIGLMLDEKDERLQCEGFVPLELIVAFKTAQKEESDFFNEFNSVIDKKIPISKNMMKLVLKKEYLGKEISVIDEFKKSSEVKFIELNNYQYPIGDIVELK